MQFYNCIIIKLCNLYMLSFPSTLNESKHMYGVGKSSEFESVFDIERLRALNLNSSAPVLQELLKEQNINIASFGGRPIVNNISINTDTSAEYAKVYYEDPLTLPSKLIATAKDYEWVYNVRAKSILNIAKADKSLVMDIAHQSVVPSMFSSQHGINALGMMPNVPLLNDIWNDPEEDVVNNNDVSISDEEARDYFINNIQDPKEKENAINNFDAFNNVYKSTHGIDLYEAGRNGLRNDPKYETYMKEKRTKEFNTINSQRKEIAARLSNCSIRELCTLSKKPNSILGQARYKYADFMYCKDLGKVPNNRLITLRRFAHPVGDHIFEMTNPKYAKNESYSFKQAGDIGRLIAWFDTDDNKLEDIIKFSYHASWKPLESKIEEKDGTADDSDSGILGMIANAMNPQYNAAVAQGHAGTHSVIGFLGGRLGINVTQGIGKNKDLLRNHDKNKVYEPKDRIASTHIYDGNLLFNNQFTLTFSYVLRGYENINPKSAFLDLIGNILEVTYRRGKFWGGSRKVIGPNANVPMFNKVHQFIDDAWDKAEGFLGALASGNINIGDILGSIAQGIGGFFSNVLNAAEKMITNPSEAAQQYATYMSSLCKKYNISGALKGYLKNAVGRPQLIAWDSLLSGADVGLWHVTIGNPKNPIVAMGNLILEDATITQSGPLGLDDFPTELKVTVSLKHARPRDITDISKMYTKGLESLYKDFANHNMTDFYKMQSGSQELNYISKNENENGDTSKEAASYNDKTPETIQTTNNAAKKAEEERDKANAAKQQAHTAWEAKRKDEENRLGKEWESKYGSNNTTTPQDNKKQKNGSDTTSTNGQPTAPNENTNVDKETYIAEGLKKWEEGNKNPSVEEHNLNEHWEHSAEVQNNLDAYKAAVEALANDQYFGYTMDNDDGPWVTNDQEARIVQSNNYSFVMTRLNIDENAV